MERSLFREKKIETPGQLEDELRNKTELGYKMSRYLIDRGLLRGLVVEPDRWVSHSNSSEGTIHVGTGNMDATLLENLYFGEPTQREAAVHRFLHEMSHLYLLDPRAEMKEDIGSLRRFSGFMRHDQNRGKRGLSAIGSHNFYSGADSTEEDITDLVALRLKSASRLSGFLDFLANPVYESERARVGLATIPNDAPALLFDMIETIISPVDSLKRK